MLFLLAANQIDEDQSGECKTEQLVFAFSFGQQIVRRFAKGINVDWGCGGGEEYGYSVVRVEMVGREWVTQGQDLLLVATRQQLSTEDGIERGGRKREGEKNKRGRRRRWTLTFRPSRKLRAVPMLATQWILFSFLPCSQGWREKRVVTKERRGGKKKLGWTMYKRAMVTPPSPIQVEKIFFEK